MHYHLGIFIIRIVVGLIFIGHGSQKLFGWFGGQGIDGTGDSFAKLGIAYPEIVVLLVGSFEVLGGILIILGVYTFLAAIMICSVMAGAIIKVHGANGFWSVNHGFEYHLLLATIAIGIALIGPGKYKLQRLR